MADLGYQSDATLHSPADAVGDSPSCDGDTSGYETRGTECATRSPSDVATDSRARLHKMRLLKRHAGEERIPVVPPNEVKTIAPPRVFIVDSGSGTNAVGDEEFPTLEVETS